MVSTMPFGKIILGVLDFKGEIVRNGKSHNDEKKIAIDFSISKYCSDF